MSNRMQWYRRRYIFLVVVIIMTVIGVFRFSGGILGVISDNDAEDLEQNSKIFSMYLDDYVKERVARLEDTAVLLGKDVLTDRDGTKKILKDRQRDFISYTLLRATGEKEFDSAEIAMNFNLVQSKYLDTLVYDKKTVVYGSIIMDANREKYVAICTPIVNDGEVVAVLVGELRVTTFDNLIAKWEEMQESCAFVMTGRGVYLTGGERFMEMLGEQSSDFITYIDNSTVKGSGSEGYLLEREIQKQKSVSVQYYHDGYHYVAELVSIENTEWFAGFVMKVQGFSVPTIQFDGGTKFVLVLTCLLWIALIVHWIFLVFRFGEGKEQVERFQTISQLDKAVLFEMQFAPKKLRFFGNVTESFPNVREKYFGEEVYDIYNLFHPEDISVRKRLHIFFEDSEEMFSAEVRIKIDEDRYGWFRIVGTLLKNPHTGMNHKFIGKVENADEQIADEKNLVERAENDLLTGVLNKKTMEDRVVESLSDIPSSTYRIFFMVDLDNFKNVNDKLGHIMGDKAIVDTANALTDVFHSDAYVGRLGGDEFAVCVSYLAFDEESLYKFIRKKADKICERNRRTYTLGDVAVNISSSVGIAVAPDMATEFEDLYKKADSALYKSKNGGKNCYHIYGKD